MGGRFLVEDQTGDYYPAPAPSHTFGTTNSNNDAVDTINPLLLEKVWVEVSDDKAMVKIMHILREKDKKKKSNTIEVEDGKEDDIKNEGTETGNSNNLGINLNATLANQQLGIDSAMSQFKGMFQGKDAVSRGDLPRRKYSTEEEDEIYERQIREYNRLQQAHLQKQTHHGMNQQVPSAAHHPHHQSATSARLQRAHMQEQTHNMTRQVPSVAYDPHRQSSTPAYAFSDNREGRMVASQNKPNDSLSRAYEQQLREYQRLQEAHIRKMQLQQNTDGKGRVTEISSAHKYEGQRVAQDHDDSTKHPRFESQAQAQHWRTSFANPTEFGVPVKPYGLQKYKEQRVAQDHDAFMNSKLPRFDPQAQAQHWPMPFDYFTELGVPVKPYGLQKYKGQRNHQDNDTIMNAEPSKFDPRAQEQDWRMSFANPTELGVPVNPYDPPQAIQPYGPLYDKKSSFDSANKLRKRDKKKEQDLGDGENSIKTMEVDDDEMEAASTLLLLGLK